MELHESLVKELDLNVPPVPTPQVLAQLRDETLRDLYTDLLICGQRAELLAANSRARDMLANTIYASSFALATGLSWGNLAIPTAIAMLPGFAAMGWHLRHRHTRTRPLDRICKAIRDIGDPVFDECRRRVAARAGTRH